ncbi:hypothetical protein OEZ85_010594 [Tetradesmus obliquus]|uniref:Peroxisomal membrane protein MPV17 n=1 Tax=Tetradesmus obliquus TaxID=3088 RepID=A0ABY8TMQ5_TETOB|nr:hypothetical protein OEZ85_010594 [Tetradesmus obliquus]
MTKAAAASPQVELQQSSAAILQPSSVSALPMPEAPALVSDSSEVLLGSMREAVAGGLQEMAASSMTAVGSSSSNSSSQNRKAKSKSSAPKPGFKFDVLRCGRLCLYSAAIGTPMGHYWYEVLEALVMPASPTAPAAVAAKVALDQLLQTPFGMALFFAVMKVMEGRPREVPQELRNKLVPGLLANWKLWPAAQLVNFTVIPPEQRILFGNIVGVCWTCVISNMQQSSSGEPAAEAPKAGASSKAAAAAAAAAATGSSAEAGTAVDARTLRRASTPVAA